MDTPLSILSFTQAEQALLSACYLIFVISLSAFILHKRYLFQIEWELSSVFLAKDRPSKSFKWLSSTRDTVLTTLVPYFRVRLRTLREEKVTFEQIIQTISEIDVEGITVSDLALQFCDLLDSTILAGSSFSFVARVSNGSISDFYCLDDRAQRLKGILPFVLTSSPLEKGTWLELSADNFFHSISSLNLNTLVLYRSENFDDFGFIVLLCIEQDSRSMQYFSQSSRENLLSYFCSRLVVALLREQQKESLLMQRDCLLALSHDMRVPAMYALNQIDEEKRKTVSLNTEEILRSTVRDQLAMVDCALLQYSRFAPIANGVSKKIIVKKNHQFAEYTWYSAPRALTQVINEVKSNFDSQILDISISKIPIVDISVPETFLRRIFSNLFSNSLEANSQVEINICVERKKNFLQIAVSDNGVGFQYPLPSIDSNFPSQITRSPEGGYGIGLRSVRQLLSYIGGHFKIIPSETGAVIELLLPCRRVSSHNELSAGLELTSMKGRSLLLLEDDTRFSNSLAEFFRNGGLRVKQRTKCSSIETLFENSLPDIIVSDRYLADGDLFAHISDDSLPKVPIIFLTSPHSVFSERCDILFLDKPFSKRELERSVCRMLS